MCSGTESRTRLLGGVGAAREGRESKGREEGEGQAGEPASPARPTGAMRGLYQGRDAICTVLKRPGPWYTGGLETERWLRRPVPQFRREMGIP